MIEGTKLGRYEIRSKIGEGGMGEVYLAQDTKLDRKVALKILPAEVAAHPDRMKRFVQEAKAASALNHPNIITIHEIDETDSGHFIATEFIDGETLRERLRSGSPRLGDALDVAAQIASALSGAHTAGIVHRDIKPENIMLRRDGIVKVLDFGLAKLSEKTDTGEVDTEAATKALVQTEPGVVMGTVAYMSPEQARGLAVDARTDIFSLGVVIYEMVAGRAPFGGATRSDLIVALLEREPPPLARFTSEAPAELERLVMKTLAKDREERYQTAKDLLIDLKGLKQKLKVDAEIERTAPSELPAEVGEAKPTDGGAVSTAPGAAAQTGVAGARPNSSAEYIISEIGRHKRSLTVALAVLLLAAVGFGYWFSARRGSNATQIESIAVLPFQNASGNDDVEYLSDGMTESLITSLSQLPKLSVKARSSVFRYKGKEVDPQVAGNELRVQAILNGRVVQRGNDLTLYLSLVDVRNGNQLWGEQYDRKLADLVSLQSEIARDVSNKLRIRLSGADEQRVIKNYTQNTEAYQLYLKGQYFSSNPSETNLKKSLEYFQQAIDKDPNYALAYAGIGGAYEKLGGFLGFVSPGETAPQGKAAIVRALSIDETLDDAHSTLAQFTLTYDWNLPVAEREYKRTIELNPNNPSGHSGYGTYFEALGRFDEAVAERERSRQLDPVSAFSTADAGYPLYYARRYEQALEYFRKGLELDPNLSWGHLWIGQVYVQQGRYDEAIAEINRAIALSGGNVRDIATLGHAYAVSGKRNEALKVLGELQSQARKKYVSPYFIALIYTGLGEREQAFAWLEKAYQQRHPYLILIKVEPVFDSLRSDPRFADLMRRVGLPQ